MPTQVSSSFTAGAARVRQVRRADGEQRGGLRHVRDHVGAHASRGHQRLARAPAAGPSSTPAAPMRRVGVGGRPRAASARSSARSAGSATTAAARSTRARRAVQRQPQPCDAREVVAHHGAEERHLAQRRERHAEHGARQQRRAELRVEEHEEERERLRDGARRERRWLPVAARPPAACSPAWSAAARQRAGRAWGPHCGDECC